MKTMPFLKILGVLSFSLLLTGLTAQVKIGQKPDQLDPSAILELDSAHLGLLITRVSLADIWDVNTIPNPANSLLVYNTNSGGGPEPVSPGFYYWWEEEGRWMRLSTGSDSPAGDVWIDDNNNLLSANSANQNLQGQHNVILGWRAFADDAGVTDNMIAIGEGAAEHDTTTGDARNIAVGYQAAHNNGGYDVIFMGRESGMNNDGNNVVGLGDYAGYENMGSSLNAIGVRAGYDNQAEFVNAIGTEAAWANAAPDVNAIGFQAAYTNSKWGVNAFGRRAAAGNLMEKVNALGESAGENNNGVNLNAMGFQAARYNQGWNVNAMGELAATLNQGSDLNAFGFQSAQYNTGYQVNAFGMEAAKFNNGDHAIAIGEQALLGNEFGPEGFGNIGIGYHAGFSAGAGFNNIAIGHDAQFNDGDASNQINIGNSIIRNADGVITLNQLIQLPAIPTPADPSDGMIYFDGSMLYCYQGGSWHSLW